MSEIQTVRKRGVVSKNVKFAIQQDILVYKLFNILDLNMYNQITLRELKTNTDKRDKILSLLDDLKRFYKLKSPSFLYRLDEVKNLQMCVIRAIISTKGITLKSENLRNPKIEKKEIVYTFNLNGYKLIDEKFFINKKNFN